MVVSLQFPKGVVCVCLMTHSDPLPIRRRGIHIASFYKWPIVQDTGSPTTHDKQAFFLGRTITYFYLVILVGLRGRGRTRNPWVGSQVFYQWPKSLHTVPQLSIMIIYNSTCLILIQLIRVILSVDIRRLKCCGTMHC